MKDLIARYDAGVRARIGEIIANTKPLEGAGVRRIVYDLKSLKTLPPIMYPTTMLNVAVNYRAHALRWPVRSAARRRSRLRAMRLPGTTSAPGIWERKPDDKRWNPYMFFKSPTIVIADGEAIRLPVGRTSIDWECELGVVIEPHGRPRADRPRRRLHLRLHARERRVRSRRPRRYAASGPTGCIGKNHDTFAPMGPFIVPKEFVPNPQNLQVKFTLNGQVMQDANTSLMIHDVFEQVSTARTS